MANAYKTLGQSKPAAATSTDLYTVPAATQAIVSSITVANQSATATKFRISVAIAGAVLADAQYYAYDADIEGNAVITFQLGLGMAPTDKIRVYNTLATLSFNATGVEIT
jgi:hypothetical protein